MANPTLVSTETPFTGFTVAQIVERLLATFGLTEDSTTGRSPASTENSAQARVFVRRAVSMLSGRFPHVFSIRESSGTWVANDHSVAMPSNCKAVLYFLFDGLPLQAISRDDELRILNPNSAAGVAQAPKTGTDVMFYRVTGFTSAGLLVLRLYATPGEAKAYTVVYNSLAPALTSDAAEMPMSTQFQEWVLAKARDLWASELNDITAKRSAQADLGEIEKTLIPDLEAMLERPTRLKWRYPNTAGRYPRSR